MARSDARRAESCRLQELYVASLRVVWVDRGAVPVSRAFGQNPKIVTVQMHRVGGWDVVTYDDSDRRITAEVVHIPFRVVRVGCVSLVG